MAHMVLGLTVALDEAVIMTSLTGSLDNEFEVIDFPNGEVATMVSQDWVKALHLGMRTLVEELETHCLSAGGAWPALLTDTSGGGNLAIGRIAGRRPCNQVNNDVSSLQLFTARSLQSNPFENIKAVQRVAERHGIDMP